MERDRREQEIETEKKEKFDKLVRTLFLDRFNKNHDFAIEKHEIDETEIILTDNFYG